MVADKDLLETRAGTTAWLSDIILQEDGKDKEIQKSSEKYKKGVEGRNAATFSAVLVTTLAVTVTYNLTKFVKKKA